jgi:DNA-binding beta-propeller fold protein YncE
MGIIGRVSPPGSDRMCEARSNHVAPSSNPTPLTLTALPGAAQAKFSDTLAIDNERHVLYLGDNWSGGVDLFDITTSTPAFLKTVKLRGRIYGIAVANNANKVFAGMSGSTLAVIDIASDHSVALVHTGGAGHVDLLDYDSTHRRLFAANRLDRLLTWIDADSNEIIGRVEGLGSGLEQPRYNPADGLVYLTDNKDNVLFQIDPESARLVETFAIQDECFPNGMAINAKNNQALLVSSYTARPHTVIWDLNTQKIASITEESGCGDGAVYVPSLDLIFQAASEFGDGPVIGVFGGDPVRFLTNVAATPGASWVDYDTANELVYAPSIVDGKPGLLSFKVPGV